jgi:hypothetical protein
VIEDFSNDIDGEMGEGGRPRIKEEVKILPEYENVDLFDANDDVLF